MKYIMNFSKVWISHQQSETILTGNHDMVINQSINQSFRDALLSTYQPPDEITQSRMRYGLEFSL